MEQNTNPSPNSQLEEYFIIIAEKGFPTKKHVSHIKGTQLISPKIPGTKWELELNIITQDDVWEDLCACSHKGINSQL